MAAYDYIDTAMNGLLYGLNRKIEGGWACAEENGIEFGAPVFGYVGDEINAYNLHLDTGKIVYSTDFVSLNSTIVTVNGVATSAVVFDTDHITTIIALVAAIDALDGVSAILDSTDTNDRTILIQTKGIDATVSSVTTLGVGQPTTVITYGSSQVFLGVSILTQNSSGIYEQNDAVNVLTEGGLWVIAGVDVLANNKAYVYGTAGINFGKWYTSGIELPVNYRSNTSASTLVRIEVDSIRTELTYSGLF